LREAIGTQPPILNGLDYTMHARMDNRLLLRSWNKEAVWISKLLFQFC